MFTTRSSSALLVALAALSPAFASPAAVSAGESHLIQIINRCGSGTPVFVAAADATKNFDPKMIFNGATGEKHPGVMNGPVPGGVAYLSGYKNCGVNGVNCATVEFSLLNANGNQPGFNGINYSLLDGVDKIKGDSLGAHTVQYSMHAEYIGGGAACEKTKLPGPCVGQSEAECAGAFLGDATEGGTPQVCLGVNAGILITFC